MIGRNVAVAGADIDGDFDSDEAVERVGNAVGRLEIANLEIVAAIESLLLDVGPEISDPNGARIIFLGVGQLAIGVVMRMHREGPLLEIVRAFHPPRRFAGRLHGGQQQRHQHADDRDYH